MSSTACSGCSEHGCSCGCCEGVERSTPSELTNRPGLPALAYRVGTYAKFLETMKARLSSLTLDIAEGSEPRRILPLDGLTTRDASDPAIALLDAWAVAGDILTFYQERIANEGYLRSATERRSVLELARLVGYAPRPGVAATAYLAFGVDPNTTGEVPVPVGTRAQSVPGPGEQVQFFETTEAFAARADWNELRPRTVAPPQFDPASALQRNLVYVAGTSTNLKPGDRLLFVFGSAEFDRIVRFVAGIEAEDAAKRTKVLLRPFPPLLAALAPALFDVVELLAKANTPSRAYLGTLWGQALLGNPTPLASLLGHAFFGEPVPFSKEAITHERLYARLSEEFEDEAVPEAEDAAAGGEVRPDVASQPAPRFARVLRRATTGRAPAITPKVVESLARRAGVLGASASGAGSAAPAAAPAPPPPPASPPTPAAPTSARVRVFESLAELVDGDSEASRFFQDTVADFLTHVARELVPNDDAEGELLAAELFEALEGAIGSKLPGQRLPALLDFAAARFDALGASKAQRVVAGLLALLRRPALNRATAELFDVAASYAASDEKKGLLLSAAEAVRALSVEEPRTAIQGLVSSLSEAPVPQLRARNELASDPRQTFGGGSDSAVQLLLGFQPRLRGKLYDSWGKASIAGQEPELQALYALRTSAPPFGHNAPQEVFFTGDGEGRHAEQREWTLQSDELPDNVFLDNEYAAVSTGNYALIDARLDSASAKSSIGSGLLLARVLDARVVARSEYGLSGRSTLLDLDRSWRTVKDGTSEQANRRSIASLRRTLVHTQSEKLTLADEPLAGSICKTDTIELDRLVDGLEAGRWLIVSGERSDLEGVEGVRASELAMLGSATHGRDPSQPKDATHTTLTLVKPLAHCYKRGTVTIAANVAKATQGESRGEVLGAGEGQRENQKFALKQPPLTFVSAATASGAASTLRVFVNEVEWQERPMLAGAAPTERVFATRTEDDGKTTVVFGNGRQGARLPSGLDNVRAEYRSGIGRGGNLKPGQLSVLVTKPLGLRDVTNPLPASGGADRETRDQARKNAPLAVRALDRLVSVRDYADFSRTFAGVGKASAKELGHRGRQVVHVTIAGAGDIPIDESSDLFKNLTQALFELGDPMQTVELAVRRVRTLVIAARLKPLPEHPWTAVYERVRKRLLEVFGFENRELGESVTSSEVVSVIQSVRGVEYADLDVLDSVGEDELIAFLEKLETGEQASLLSAEQPRGRIEARLATFIAGQIAPAELAYLNPDVPDTLVLNRIEEEP
jgi:predicted phage baseplate assembly protein